MKLLKLWRTFKEGFSNFFRNGWLSIATISVLAISLYIISLTFVMGMTANMILSDFQEKINISVYFNPNVPESDILDIRNQLKGFDEIKEVDYVSKDQALDELKDVSGDDPSISRALDVIGENPLLPSLLVKAKDPNQYQLISNLIGESFGDKISRISYDENKSDIEQLNRTVKAVRQDGIILGIIFVVMAILVTFNTIRITIYSHRQEFEIMRLVGASNTYVEMPYIFEGAFYGITASVVSMLVLFLTVKFKFLSNLTGEFFLNGQNSVSIYLSNFWMIFGVLMLGGIFLGVISSFIAIRRYLKK